jgi:hypothetical protein
LKAVVRRQLQCRPDETPTVSRAFVLGLCLLWFCGPKPLTDVQLTGFLWFCSHKPLTDVQLTGFLWFCSHKPLGSTVAVRGDLLGCPLTDVRLTDFFAASAAEKVTVQ